MSAYNCLLTQKYAINQNKAVERIGEHLYALQTELKLIKRAAIPLSSQE